MVTSVLPDRLAYSFQRTERYGFIILLVLLFTGIIGRVLAPLYGAMYAHTLALFGLA
jgi:Zn-dependent protease